MTKEELNNVLVRPREMKRQVERCKEEVVRLKLEATANGAIRYDKDRVLSSPVGDLMENKVIAIVDKELELNRLKYEASLAKEKAFDVIGMLNNPLYRKILILYYVNCMSCRDIGETLDKTTSNITTMKSRAIDCLMNKLSENS